MEANDTNSLETEVPLDNNLNSPYCIFSLLSNFMKKYSELIYNNIENELLKDVTYSQILISFLLLWILYRVYNSIDLHKILHKFTYRKSTEIDANIINKMEKYWVKKLTTGVETCNGKLPDEPWSEDTIKEKISQLAQKEGVNCPNGGVIRHPYKSESDCKSNSDKVAKEANGMFFKSNPLHFDIFDGVCKMEAEVIQMCNNLYKGGDSGCGIVDTSEADCIRDAALAYKKWAKECKNITKPNIVAPATFDPSLERACLMLEIEFRRVSVGDDVRVFVEDIIAKTDSNTVAIFCSAPDQYFGVIDPVEKIAEYAHQNYIGCHVDCNYSSFFMNVGLSMLEREFNINFEVKGITSIGVSLSRYALGPCGTAILLYKTRKLRRYQYFSTTKWNGGIYFTPNLTGSRYGSAIAAAWTKILTTGLNKYRYYAKSIVDVAIDFKKMLEDKEEIEVITPQSFSIIAFRLKEYDTYELADFLRFNSFAVVNTINPPAISYTITNANYEFCLDMKDKIDSYFKLKKGNKEIHMTDQIREFYQDKEVLKKFVEMKHHAPFIANKAN